MILDDATLSELKMIPGVFPRRAGDSYSVRCTPDVAFVLDEKKIPYTLVKRPPRAGAPIASFAPRLLDYQRENAERLRADEIRALVWGTGVRKSATALTAAIPPALIVTRSAARDVFPRDGAWTWPGAPFAVILGERADTPGKRYAIQRANKRLVRLRATGATVEAVGSAHEALDAAFVVIGWDTLWAHADDLLGLRRWETIIWDESHTASGRLSRRTKAAHALAHAAVRSWILTATLMPDRPANLPAQLALIDRDAWGSGYQFVHRYCDARWNAYGGLETRGSSHIDELNKRIGYWASVLTKKDVAHTLPSARFEIMRVDASRSSARMPLGRGREAAIAWAAEAKLGAVTDRVVECLREREKVVLVGGRRLWVPRAERMVRKKLAKTRFGDRVWLRATSGDDSIDKRLELVAEFQALDDLACLIATIESIGQSIDIQQTDRTIIAFLPDTPKSLVQLVGRFQRHGGRPWTGEFWVADGTLDEAIEDRLLSKAETIVQAGVETADMGLKASGLSEDAIVAELSAWLAERAADIDGAVLEVEE